MAGATVLLAEHVSPERPLSVAPSPTEVQAPLSPLSDASTIRDAEKEISAIEKSQVQEGTPSSCESGVNMTERKHETQFMTTRIDSISSIFPQPPTTEARIWKTTFIRYGPLSELLGLCIAIASIFAALGILIGSRNQPVKSWSLEPSAYLAIFTAIANQSVRYATVQGVAIAWWYRASRRATLSSLHHDWRSGTTIRGALTAGRHIGLLGIACIFSTIVAVDGPLLQKATSVVPSPWASSPLTLNVKISQEVPRQWAGLWIEGGGWPAWSTAFNATMPSANGTTPNNITAFAIAQNKNGNAWFTGEPMTGVVRGCPPSVRCAATLRAPALAKSSCTSQLVPVNYLAPTNITHILTGGYTVGNIAPPLTNVAFLIQPSLMINDGRESINLITAYSQSNDECVGTLNITACTLEGAVGEYTVQIYDDVATLNPGEPMIVALANNTWWPPSVHSTGLNPSTLAGIVGRANENFLGAAWYAPSTHPQAIDDRITGEQAYLESFRSSLAHEQHCPAFLDPHDSMMDNLNALMFSAGAFAAKVTDVSTLTPLIDDGLPVETSVAGHLQGNHNVYHTNFHWFIAAALVELTCIALVLPTYWGWWKLGRSVSFSPLEVAKAFEAPLLVNFNSNSSGTQMARAAGDTEVQYGETRDIILQGGVAYSERKRLAFAAPESIKDPRKNERFEV